MARTRNIKPGFFTNDKLLECEPLARILFAGLWCHADREGRIEDRPKKFKIEILPADECNVVALLDQLERGEFIVRYQVGEVRYIAVPTFGKHQNPHKKEVVSTIPAPGQHRAGTGPGRKKKQAGVPPGDGEPGLLPSSFPSPPSLPPNPRKRGALSAEQSSEFESWYALYPHKIGRGAAERAWASARALASIEDLKAGVERYVGTKRPDVPWCNPATWLNAKRWMDAPADPKPAEPTVSPLEEALKLSRLAKWSGRLGEFKQTGKWQSTWGSEPWTTNSGCFVPVEMRPDFVAAYRSMTAPPIDPPEQRSIQ